MRSSKVVDGRERLGTRAEVEAHYEAILAEQRMLLAEVEQRQTRWLQGLLAALALIAWLTVRSLHGGSGWPLLAAFLAAAGVTSRYLKEQARGTEVRRVVDVYERALRRVRGEETQSGSTGEALRTVGHLYERDLNLLGPDSLFGMLDTVRTGIGQRGLAAYLQGTASHAESVLRQEAVRELAGRTELRERIALLGRSRFQQVDARFFDEWLDEETALFHPVFRVVLALTSAALLVMLGMGLWHVVEWGSLLPNLALIVLVHAGVSMYLQTRVKPILAAVTRLSNHVQMFSDGLAVLEKQTFTAGKLRAIQAAGREPANAVPELSKLQGLITVVQQRTKEWFYVLSLLLAAGTQAAMSIAAWKARNGAAMRGWLAAWAEFEALNALAGYAFEHPEDVWPELLPEGESPVLEARSLGHPLLPGCVRNDVALGQGGARFLLISGSNMSGKSTLMRTVGINAVLAYAGAPVRAERMRLTPLRLGASLALTDSLAEGKSKFLAEVERLQKIVRASEEGPVLFLVDEIFSGTNSADRRMAAGAVLGRLLGNGAIGALSTHDLALTDLANAASGGMNVHMASPDAEDPLGFDYKLKPGVNTSSNARAIIRMMGLEVGGDELP